jgi:outer membrane protein TolC
MKNWINCVRLCAAFAFAGCHCAWAQNLPPGSDLAALLALAQDNNPELASLRFEASAAQARVTQADALPDPRLRIELQDLTRGGTQGATLTPNQVGSTKYTLMQDIPWFGTRDLRRESAQHSAQSAESQTQGLWLDLAARIKDTYAQIYFLHHSEILVLETQSLLAQLERIALIRYANGLAPQQDAIRAQTAQSELRNELLSLRSERRQAEARLNTLLARPPRTLLSPPQTLRPLPAPEQLDYATLEPRVLSNNPLLATEDQRAQAAEKNSQLALKNRFPTVTLGISPTQYQDSFREWGLMLEMNIPLQQSNRRAQERELQAMADAAHARRESMAQQVLAELSDNLTALDSARHTEELVRNALQVQAALTLQAALAGYETGRVDFATVLDAQRQTRQARQTELMAQVEGQKRLAQIERLLGEDL